MPLHDPERLNVANNARIELALENELSSNQARAYVRCLQIGWNVPPIHWSENDSHEQMSDARRLIHSAEVFREIEGTTSSRSADCYRRAGEILEWLARSTDQVRTLAPIELFSAAAFQLGGLPAMAAGLLEQIDFEDPGSALFASFLRADFDRVLLHTARFWQNQPELTNKAASRRLLLEESEDRLSWYFTIELIRAIGLFADSIRRGDDDRLTSASAKLKALDAMALRTFSDDVSMLIALLHQVGQSYVESSIYRPMHRLITLNPARSNHLLTYARDQFARGRGILWSSQLAGLEKLLHNSSFALCTPTGSGKTLVANLSLVKELLLREHGDIVPLALYLVPSRALAGEVEAKLTSELGNDLIITGLYGGADWGITDYWLNADRPTVLIATVEKADALMRYLAPFLVKRLCLLIVDEAHQIIPEDNDSGRTAFAEHSSRALRLESFVSRLLTLSPNIVRIALTAVAGGAAGPVARWMEGTPNATAIGTRYRSTRQIIGVLETAPEHRCTMQLDLMNGRPLYVQGRDVPVYLNLQISPMPQLPATMRTSLYRFNQMTVLWTALHLVEANRRILISLAQEPEQTMRWFKEAFDLPEWKVFPEFIAPDGWPKELFEEALASCIDYCGEEAFETNLLKHGIATSHGQMPQRLRRLMTALIEEKICPITVATATLTEGVNLPFDIIFVTALKRSNYNRAQKQMIITPYTPAEFRNLAGRAGRPGTTKGMEGITLVALPTSIVSTAKKQKPTQQKQLITMRKDYEDLRSALLIDERGEDNTLSPLTLLLDELRKKVQTYFRFMTDESFLSWLEQALPENISAEAGTGASDTYSQIADTVDDLDAFILTALEELKGLDDELNAASAESQLARLWQRTFTAAAAVREAWLEQAVIRRGRALIDTIYPNADERRRLYQYGFSPFIGRRFEAVAPEIANLISNAFNYGIEDPDMRIAHLIAIGELLKEDRGFGFQIRDTQTDKHMLETWTDIIAWWMRLPSSEHPNATDLRARQRFVSDNLEFRLGTAIGGVVAQRWTSGAGNPLAIPSLADWRETTGLPWFGFWARELLRWGTLDPFVAFALAQGHAKTREAAETLRPIFDDWLAGEISNPTSEDLIDPQHFLSWERSLPRRAREVIEHPPESAALTGTTGARKQYNVIPVPNNNKEVIWFDAAGYELARSDDELGSFNLRDVVDDFVLTTESRQASVTRTFRRRSKR